MLVKYQLDLDTDHIVQQSILQNTERFLIIAGLLWLQKGLLFKSINKLDELNTLITHT